MNSTRVHPRFDHPPVIETAFSIEFSPLSGWAIPFFGLYWETIRSRYPKLNVQAPLPSYIEDLNTPPPPVSLSIGLVDRPQVRCWFYNEVETQLIQIQENRFVFNWKRGLTDEPYPHYESIRPVILDEWGGFIRFAQNQGFGHPKIQQCEITYINHIEIGQGWKDYSELGDVLPCWSGRASQGFLPAPEDVEINVRYLLPERRGRLYVRAQPAIRNADQKEIIQLTVLARGGPGGHEMDRVFDWFDWSQDAVVRGFLDFTSEKMHSLWGIRSER